jgi:hypothetical protein
MCSQGPSLASLLGPVATETRKDGGFPPPQAKSHVGVLSGTTTVSLRRTISALDRLRQQHWEREVSLGCRGELVLKERERERERERIT